jgi:CRP/FNR family transcriptional regulator, cyclic AMP receptor protein
VSQTADSLSASELFEGLTDAAVADLDGKLAAARFHKGELVYSPFDRGDALYLIEAGRVRLYRSAHDGRQLTMAMLDEGEAFGLVPSDGDDRHDCYAEAMSDSILRIVPAADLARTAAEHPLVAMNLLRSLSQRVRHVEDRLEALAFRGVAARLAGQLLELMDRYGRVTPAGIRIDERFTHMQLAEMIGTSRETLTKVLNELRDAGVIDVRERLVWVLDADGLEQIRAGV